VSDDTTDAVLVHLASGIGNIVLATPLLMVLARQGYTVDVLLDADYTGVSELLQDWSALRTVYDLRRERPAETSYTRQAVAIPPFYWGRYARRYARYRPYRPPDDLFFRDEQAYYLEFGRALGCEVASPPYYFLPIAADAVRASNRTTLVLAPGSKTGQMAAKRWPYFAKLADAFEDVVVVGTPDDLTHFDGSQMRFPNHVRSFVGNLSIRETAEVIAGAGAVVANDCGLGHIAGALGVPTVLLFGPTPDRTLGRLPPNVTVLRSGLACEPCWLRSRLAACDGQVHCLNRLSLDSVLSALSKVMFSQKAVLDG
jgi:ADP-heptose:LPS heptosyltransferase